VRPSARWLLAATLVAAPLGAADAPVAPPLPQSAARWVGAPAALPDPGRRVTLVFVWTFG
jgi:hypothetical protein